MNKVDTAVALVAIARDEARAIPERAKAFDDADAIRKDVKVGWSKLGLQVEQVEGLKALFDGQERAADMPDGGQERTAEELKPLIANPEVPIAEKPKDDGFEATEEELAKQVGREKVDEAAEDAAAAERAAKKVKASKGDDGKPKGGLTRLVESLLMDPALTYSAVCKAVAKEYPKCQTSTRSVASVAAAMRRKGKDVPMRRVQKAEKPAEKAEA